MRKRISARMHFISNTKWNETRENPLRSVLHGDNRSGNRYFHRACSLSGAHLFRTRPVVRRRARTFIDVRRLHGVLVTMEFEGPHADLGILPGIGRDAPWSILSRWWYGRWNKKRHERAHTFLDRSSALSLSLSLLESGICAASNYSLSLMLQKEFREHVN